MPQAGQKIQRIARPGFEEAPSCYDASVDKRSVLIGLKHYEEKMDWDQFIVNEKDLNSVITKYDCSAIPTVIFTDQSGKILKRYEGFSKNALEYYEVFIKNSLK